MRYYIRFKSIMFLALVIISFSSCKRGGKAVKTSVKLSKTYVKKSTNKLFDSDLKSFVSTNKLPKNSKSFLKTFTDKEKELLANDLARYSDKPFSSFIKKSPENLEAYKALSNSPNLRVKIDFLRNYSEQIKSFPGKVPILELQNIRNLNAVSLKSKLESLNNKNKQLGVRFKTKLINFGTYSIKGIFPDFSKQKLIEVKMPSSMYEKKNNEQFFYATRKLQKEFKDNREKVISRLRELNKGQTYEETVNGVKVKLSGEKLLERQIKDLEDPRKNKIFGFTWHHNENPGQMDLIIEKVHNSVDHTGGQVIWGANR